MKNTRMVVDSMAIRSKMWLPFASTGRYLAV